MTLDDESQSGVALGRRNGVVLHVSAHCVGGILEVVLSLEI